VLTTFVELYFTVGEVKIDITEAMVFAIDCYSGDRVDYEMTDLIDEKLVLVVFAVPFYVILAVVLAVRLLAGRDGDKLSVLLIVVPFNG